MRSIDIETAIYNNYFRAKVAWPQLSENALWLFADLAWRLGGSVPVVVAATGTRNKRRRGRKR
jgi:hypothetical protein